MRSRRSGRGGALALWMLACGIGLASLAWGVQRAAPQPPSSHQRPGTTAELAELHARCVADMLRQTCGVMSAGAAGEAPSEGLVFVAGVGSVRAEIFDELRASGSTLCDTVAQHCRQEWNGSRCQVARALHGLP